MWASECAQCHAKRLLYSTMSHATTEESTDAIAFVRGFAGGASRAKGVLKDETAIESFTHLFEKCGSVSRIFGAVDSKLVSFGLGRSKGSILDAKSIVAASSFKNASGSRGPKMHRSKKGDEFHFGRRVNTGVDAETGIVHSLAGTPANGRQLSQVRFLFCGSETDGFADARFGGVVDKMRLLTKANWRTPIPPSKRRILTQLRSDRIREQNKPVRPGVRAKEDQPFRVVKRQLGFTRVRYGGLAKNTASLLWWSRDLTFGIWMAR